VGASWECRTRTHPTGAVSFLLVTAPFLERTTGFEPATPTLAIAWRSSHQHVDHPLVGDLTLSNDALEFPADPGQTMLVYTAESGSLSQEALDILASLDLGAHQGSGSTG
jgi:MmyB-like transcription regulator ligand binding domain